MATLEPKTHFHQRLNAIHRSSKLTRAEFAAKAFAGKVSPVTVGKLETMESAPTNQNLEQVAALGGVSVEWLVDGVFRHDATAVIRPLGLGHRVKTQRSARAVSLAALAFASKTLSVFLLERVENGDAGLTWPAVCELARLLRTSPISLAFGVTPLEAA